MSRTVWWFGCLSLLLLPLACGSCSRSRSRPAAAEPSTAPQTEPRRPSASSALYDATAELIRALREEDIPSFLDHFSEAGTWRILSTHAVVPADLTMTRAQLARELEARGPMHSFLFGPRPWALRAFTVAPYEEPWQPLNAVQFGPPDVRRGEVSIAWRQEGAKWVVDAIAWPIR